MEATQRISPNLLASRTPLPVRILRPPQLAGQNRTCRYWATSAFGGWVATALHFNSGDGGGMRRDGDEGIVLILCSWSRCGCSLWAHPSQESSAAYRSVARLVRNGAR